MECIIEYSYMILISYLRNVLRHFRFKLFLTEKSYKFGVVTINRKISGASRIIG